MISLFRKIKRQLLAENKITRYLTYAVGEIFLIVIGILIALAINNWNQRRIIRDKEQFYLAGLQTEFERSRIKLDTLIEVNRMNYQESRKIADLADSSKLQDETELSKLLYNSFSFEIAYSPNNSLLNEIMNSGGLKNISNPELRKHLTSWESRIQSIHRQEQTLREQRDRIIDIFRNGQGSIRTILDDAGITTGEMKLKKSQEFVSNLPVVKSQEFENNLLLFILTGMITENTHYRPLLDEIDSILGLISSEIKQ